MVAPTALGASSLVLHILLAATLAHGQTDLKEVLARAADDFADSLDTSIDTSKLSQGLCLSRDDDGCDDQPTGEYLACICFFFDPGDHAAESSSTAVQAQRGAALYAEPQLIIEAQKIE